MRRARRERDILSAAEQWSQPLCQQDAGAPGFRSFRGSYTRPDCGPLLHMVSSVPMAHTPQANDDRANKLAYYLLKAVNKANRRYRMFADGDTILVAVSGGKDSLTLLDLLRRRRRVARERYSIIAGSVRTDSHCGAAVPEEWLATWCEERDIPLVVDRIEIADELAQTTANKCFRCSWNRRKTLFQMADRLGCNKVAFGHHADDIAQTTLMNLFYSGRLYRMEPKVSFFGGRLIVIRPLAFVEERDIVPFVRASGFPLSGEPCPESLESRRALVKRLLREVESDSRHVKRSIHHAVERCNAMCAQTPRSEASIDDKSQLG